MKPEPWAEALDSRCRRPGIRGDRAAPRRAGPGRRAVHPGPRARARRRAVAGLRVRSLRGDRRAGLRARREDLVCRSRSCPSATTSSTGARSPCSPSSRPSPGCCPASSATPSPSSRSPTRTDCSSTPSTPSRRRGPTAAWSVRSRRCCSPVTTARSPRGGITQRLEPHGGAATGPAARLAGRAGAGGPVEGALDAFDVAGDAGRRPGAAHPGPGLLGHRGPGQRHARHPAPGRSRCEDVVDESVDVADLDRALGRSAGRGLGAWSSRPEDPSTWQVGRLMVAPDLQGRGLGRALLAHVELRRRRTPRLLDQHRSGAASATCAPTARPGTAPSPARARTPGRVDLTKKRPRPFSDQGCAGPATPAGGRRPAARHPDGDGLRGHDPEQPEHLRRGGLGR